MDPIPRRPLVTIILENVMMFLWTQGDFGDIDRQVLE